ncbi:hypothetical protein CERSUDRAFT_23108, partial [Gelatoporia subvermispora B]
SGPFAGHTLRGELEELQKADLGRKYASDDRRPLDPPPIVRLRLIQVLNPGSMHESESEIENYDEPIAFGLTCHVDLFPVYEDRSEDLPFSNESRSTPSAEVVLSVSVSCITDPAIFSATSDKPYPQAFSATELYSNRNTELTASSTITSPDIVAYFNGYAITESSNCTSQLVGSSFAHAVATKYHGVEMFIFVFPDIAVQMEGTFVFRYRVFDVCAAAAGERGMPMLAECFGGPFKVWSTKEFPGLRPSTELTKHVSALGIRTHIRMNERKRRRPCP